MTYSLTKALSKAPQQAPTSLDVIPRTFLGFCAWLSVELTPGQTELARMAFDGMEPLDRGLSEQLFGQVPVGLRSIVAAVCGARAGKSYVLVALRLVWGMFMRDLHALRPGARAAALVIAPKEEHRQEVMRYALGAVMSKPELSSMLQGKPTADKFVIRRPDGAKVEFRTGVASVGGTAARAGWWTDVALDECAFFRDGSYKINDDEIFKAATPRVLPGGQLILASTPWAQTGLLYEMWSKRPTDTLVAHAPTLTLHDSDLTRSIVERETQRDPDNAKREYGAQFMTSGTTVFFERASVDLAFTDEPFTLQPHDIVAAGVDLAFVGDSSALILVAIRGDGFHIFDGREERPQEGLPLNPEQTIKSFVQAIKGRCSYVMADKHYWLTLANECNAHGLHISQAPTVPADTYVRARQLLRGQRVKIHPLPFKDRLHQQMAEVQGRPTSGGGLSIMHPRWATGGHGDLVAALVLALWQVSGESVPTPEPALGTREWEQARVESRRRKFVEQQSKPDWMPKAANDRGAGAWWRK